MRASLDEREALLRELHRRVKNNIQVITSLLEMQARHMHDPRASAALVEAQHRITSIASIYELLYQEGTSSRVELAAYARERVPRLVSFYQAQEHIQTSVAGENVLVSLDCAVPCGLLLNVLVPTSASTPFPAGHRGTRGHPGAGRGATRLRVRDNGLGLPAGFDPCKSPTLGTQPVHPLARQHGGAVAFRNGNGMHAEVSILSGTPKGAAP